MLIFEEQSHAVELQLADIFGMASFQSLHDSLMEGSQVLLIIGIVQRDQRKRMPNGGETLAESVTDAPGRAVRRDELGMFLFKLLKPLEQTVVLLIRDLGPGEDIVQTIVPSDLGAESFDFLFDIHRRTGAQKSRY